MLWIKNHQPLSLLLFSVAAFFLFFLLGPSLSCSAASQSYTFDSTNISTFTYLCNDDSTNTPHCSDYNFIVFESNIVLPDTTPRYNMPYLSLNITGSQSTPFRYEFISDYSVFSLDFINNSSSVYYAMFINSSSLVNGNNLPADWSLTVTLYDVLPNNCPVCPDCPEIPETPYGDKLDKIYNAIMIGSATLLVIYFFFAIYSMFFGGLKK